MFGHYPNFIIVMMVQLKKPNKKNQPKRPIQNGWVQIDLSKMALWSSWTSGQKNHMGGFFDRNSW